MVRAPPVATLLMNSMESFAANPAFFAHVLDAYHAWHVQNNAAIAAGLIDDTREDDEGYETSSSIPSLMTVTDSEDEDEPFEPLHSDERVGGVWGVLWVHDYDGAGETTDTAPLRMAPDGDLVPIEDEEVDTEGVEYEDGEEADDEDGWWSDNEED